MALDCAKFVSVLRMSSPQVHIFHHQTTSYSEHKALNKYYEPVLDVIDRLVEGIEGVYPRIEGYEAGSFKDWTSTEDTIIYFKNLYKFVQAERQNIYQETWIQNIVDEIAELIASILFLLSLN